MSMQVITHGLDKIEQHILRPSVKRSYTTTVFNSEKVSHTYNYQEPEIKEYVFPGGIAISGSQTGHFPGVVCGSDFHLGDFGKGNKASRSQSPFWDLLDPKHMGKQIDLHVEDKKCHTFTEPVNIIFNLGFYYHWFYEDLALLTFMRNNTHKIITNQLTEYQRESLESMPDIKARIVELPSPWVIEAPEIHVYSKPDNEDEVRQFLEARGFEYFDSFARLDLQAKVDLLHETSVVVSAAGSNLSHVYAMQPNTRVIDFNHKFLTGVEQWYKSVGTVAQLEWTSCGMQTGSASGRARLKNNNLIVDTALLEEAIG